MSTRSRVKAHHIPDDKFKEAITWLEEGKTKKGACEILGVSSNSTMERLISEWQEEQTRSAEMRKKKRGTSLTNSEVSHIIESYMQGDSLDSISKRIYRSVALVKSELERRGANLRYAETIDPAKPLELNPPVLPDPVVAYSFSVGELVWVSAYQCIDEIKKKISEEVYRVWLLSEAKQMNVHQYVWDLGSMSKFKDVGVDVKSLGYKWDNDQVIPLLRAAVEKALSRSKDSRGKD